jgi:hypothetical protein
MTEPWYGFDPPRNAEEQKWLDEQKALTAGFDTAAFTKMWNEAIANEGHLRRPPPTISISFKNFMGGAK